jgi:hypothetical protein
MSFVLVVGVGRSGTSLFTGILGRLGFHIPQPEVQADESNPKGFGEPKWVVDFHSRLMRRKRVTVFDARPLAWEKTAEISADPQVVGELRTWLAGELAQAAGDVVVKDPRVGWFLPLWQEVAAGAGAPPAFVQMLRHPAQILTSAKKNYGTWQSDASRAAAWINVTLETERATRGRPRAYVLYPELLADWSAQVRRVGSELGIERLAALDPAGHPEVDALVDPSLFRNRTGWEGLEVPDRVIAMAEDVWRRIQAPGDGPALDEARAAYEALYGEAEAISQSSVIAVRPRKGGAAGASTPRTLRARIVRRLPGGLRRSLQRLK